MRDAITQEQYTNACTRLISQYKTTEAALRTGQQFGNVQAFIAHYYLDCPRAIERLVNIGVPATVVHNTTSTKADSVNVAQTVSTIVCVLCIHHVNINTPRSFVRSNTLLLRWIR